MKNKEEEARTYAAPALEKGLDILEALSRADAPLTQKDIAQQLGRSVGEIYRMLSCLVRRNYVAQRADTYDLTTKLFELAHQNPPTRRLLEAAPAVLERLAERLDQACHLSVYGRACQIVIARADPPSGLGFSMRVGAELDVLVSTTGRVLVAFQDPATRAARIEESLRRRPEHADPRLDQILDGILARGFETMPSNQLHGVLAVGFPILDGQGRAVAAINVPYVERIDLTGHPMSEILAAAAQAAIDLTGKIGGTPPDFKLDAFGAVSGLRPSQLRFEQGTWVRAE